MGWALIFHQMLNPLNQLNTELSKANTDLKKLVNDLAAEKNRAESLNRELQSAHQYKSEFLAMMSHELRTPLNSIIGYSELLRNGLYGQLTDKQFDRMEKIYRNGKGLLDLINDILDLSRIDSGRMLLENTSLHLETVIEQLVPDIEGQCTAKSLELVVDVEQNVALVYGDERRLRQVLLNLLENAVKFTRAGSITLKLMNLYVKNGVSPALKLPIGLIPDGDWVVMSVTDTGIGIPAEQQARIFDEFAQVDNSRTREYEGTGLGLSVASRLVEMHGGYIWVESVLGQGSTFRVALPAYFETKPSIPGFQAMLKRRGDGTEYATG
jgi:signal transduction histidine kinase